MPKQRRVLVDVHHPAVRSCGHQRPVRGCSEAGGAE
eukprot:CAMPEP_0118950862 /NCGR_PEP_ID=MMETSP1169-20130426/52135_1 /TAXON_ID=36882 /ORGANISM="Pyramimonas obovata, Strain CCMP722" /LENGTH=35 /DNA_ID=CAMNT_0006897795 /DNA_START=620 /DNA_END=724 /DNA_ORIENTATION=+